jgi:glutathione synthase/RimK-type ligase-like ATP-grasp enzyme
MLIKETGITRYRKGSVPDLLINYGLAGEKQNKFFTKYAKAKNVPTINARCGINKYKAVKLVKDFGLLAPESKSSLSRTDSLTDWLEKKYNSHCGIGICIAKQKESLKSKYYQKFIKDRVFELRVHAFSWMPEKEWTVLKRLGDKNTIAWNFSQGGHFSTARNSISAIAEEARKLSTSILKILHLEFGAIDFIVDNKKNIFFIEINTQPGMTGLSDAIYIKAFNKLKGMTKENIIKQFNHIT